MKKIMKSLLVLILLMTILTACAQTATEDAASAAGAALAVTGSVDNEISWAFSELQAMESINVETTNKEGETVENSGVPLLTLLEEASLQDGAASLTFVGADGYEASVDLAEIEACSECIVALHDNGELKMVLPEFSGKFQVKGVVEIQVE